MQSSSTNNTQAPRTVCTPANERAIGVAIARADESGVDHLVSVCQAAGQLVDPIHWLSGQIGDPRVYWRSRWTSDDIGGVGAAALIRENGEGAVSRAIAKSGELLCRVVCSDDIPDAVFPRFFGGAAFDVHSIRPRIWSEYDDAVFVLPEIVLITHGGRSYFIATTCVSGTDSLPGVLDRLERRLEQLRTDTPSTLPPLPDGMLADSDISYGQWREMLTSALQRIDNGDLQKVVLSRSVEWEPSGPVSAWSLLNQLRTAHEGTYCFALQLSPDTAFLSVTPERLVRLSGRDVETDCIAGTATRSTDPVRDRELSCALLESLKDRREHGFVVEGIVESLRGVCTHTDVGGDPWLMRLPTVQHLVTTAHARLRDGVSPAEVVSRLHPTPAVGGTPRTPALDTIRRLEPNGRGWYAGPIGWIGIDAAEFAVAIRSALLTSESVHVFAGAGIVKGSQAEREWAETNAKAQSILNIIQR